MTVGDLDRLIGRLLSTGPKTAERIHAAAGSDCTLYDVEAALRVWIRNGRVRELGTGAYELSKSRKTGVLFL